MKNPYVILPILALVLAGCVTSETKKALEASSDTIDRLRGEQERLENELRRSETTGVEVAAGVTGRLSSLARELKDERDKRTALEAKAETERANTWGTVSGTFGSIIGALAPLAGGFGGPVAVTALSMLSSKLQSRQRRKEGVNAAS